MPVKTSAMYIQCDNITDDLDDDVFACVLYFLRPVIHQQDKSDLFFVYDLIRQPQGIWFYVKWTAIYSSYVICDLA